MEQRSLGTKWNVQLNLNKKSIFIYRVLPRISKDITDINLVVVFLYAFLPLDAKVYTLDLEAPAFQAVSVQLITD